MLHFQKLLDVFQTLAAQFEDEKILTLHFAGFLGVSLVTGLILCSGASLRNLWWFGLFSTMRTVGLS